MAQLWTSRKTAWILYPGIVVFLGIVVYAGTLIRVKSSQDKAGEPLNLWRVLGEELSK